MTSGEFRKPMWDAERVLAFRHYLGFTQEQMAAYLGTAQATISDWETARHQTLRRTSQHVLNLMAERAGFWLT